MGDQTHVSGIRRQGKHASLLHGLHELTCIEASRGGIKLQVDDIGFDFIRVKL